MNNKIVVEPYDPAWPEIFARESALIQNALGVNCVAVHHVGSTAIPGMSAKPIIDMIPAVKDITAVDQANEAMMKLGYTCNGEAGMLFRRFFTKPGFNIHVYESDAGELDRLLKFRDWMRIHPDDAQAYADLKLKLAVQFASDRFLYTMNKENFIASIDKKTGFDGLRIVKTLTDREWSAYHRIRKQQIFDLLQVEYDVNHPTLKDEAHIHLVLYKGSEIVGAAHLEFLSDTEAALRPFAIDAPYQNAGTGSKFLIAIERWLKQQGVHLLRLHAYSKALTFYQRLGYVPMPFPEDNHLPNIDPVDMGKYL
ncbi:MAG TPA: bifunctional GrpB family protein/GNAT family N-acetyltransferase [Gammaproteobacteria bacterium]|jgi:GrpB-like predicted nucleotidyltransferase (UPF0157 family)/GNAT superfamily N-acetyltransferase|nr:bifunctional GrpB family protein/GNAT family N-acetyltransferase [Gammaproteobacteria bacterium]